MARSYLGRSGGFSDGFTSGFGLMNQAYNDKRKLDQREEALDYERERNQAADAESLRRFEATQSAADRAAKLDQQRLEAQNEANEISRDIAGVNASTAATRAETERLRQEGLNTEAEAGRAEIAKAERLEAATAGLADLQIMMNAPVGTYTNDQIMAAIKSTDDTVLSVRKYLGADVQAQVAGLSGTIRQGLDNGDLDLNNRAILDGMSTIFDSQRGNLIGQTVNENFPNAPDAYKDGNWEVVDRRVIGASADPNSSSLNAQVTVVLRDKRTGKAAYYDAPLTASRDPSGDPAEVSIEDAISGIAGVSMMIGELEKNRPLVEQAIIRSNFKSERDFNAQVDAELQTLKASKLDSPTGRNILSSKDNSLVPDDQLRAIARSNVLGLGQKRQDFYSDRQRTITKVREVLSKSLARASGPNGEAIEFQDSQILRLASLMDGESVNPSVIAKIKSMAEDQGGEFDSGRARVDRRGRPVN